MALSDEMFEKRVRLLKLLDGVADNNVIDAGRAAMYLDMSPSTLAHRRSAGLPPPYRKTEVGQGAKVGYCLGDLRQFIEKSVVHSTAEDFQRKYGSFIPDVSELWHVLDAHPFWRKVGSDSLLCSVFQDVEKSFEYFQDANFEVEFYPWYVVRDMSLSADETSDLKRLVEQAEQDDCATSGNPSGEFKLPLY